MRFAEHMLLEAKVHGLVPYARVDWKGDRCALGLVETRGDETWVRRAEIEYPWIREEISGFPCKCVSANLWNFFQGTHEAYLTAEAAIAHLFNEHVMQGGKGNPGAEPWTMEKLADWIESVDPTPRESSEKRTEELVQELVSA